jgi:hypothetical protein
MVLWVDALIIDKYRLSMVVDLPAQITLSVVLDERKRPVFRLFGKVSARFGGNVFALRAALGSPPLPIELGIVHPFHAQASFHSPPLL